LVYPILLGLFLCFLIFLSWYDTSTTKRMGGDQKILWFLTIGAWMASLFPVSGIIRVGTFIADRIVISSTVATSILWSRVSHGVLYQLLSCKAKRSSGPTKARLKNSNAKESSSRTIHEVNSRINFLKVVICIVCLTSSVLVLWAKIQKRSSEWMCPVSLLRSSLRTCPRCAKSHLEMGKVYLSGISGVSKDLKLASYHFHMAEEIDPNFCDVNHQIAQLHIQNNDVLQFEERLTKGVICKFTMTGSYSLFQQYWGYALKDPIRVKGGAKERYDAQWRIIQKAIEEEEKLERKESKGEGLWSQERSNGAEWGQEINEL
jgi:hypothetical protein